MSEELKPVVDKGWLRSIMSNVNAPIIIAELARIELYAEAIHSALPPDHTALVRQLVEVLGEAEAIAKDHIKLLEEAKWTRAQAEEIILARTMLENIQQSLTSAKEYGF